MSQRLEQQTTDSKFGKSIYNALPMRYRLDDHSHIQLDGKTKKMGFLQRFIEVFGETYDDFRDRYGELLNHFDPEMCPADILDYLAQDYGWPLRPDLTEGFKRHLIKNIFLIYKYIGRRNGFESVFHSHTGITVKSFQVNERECIRLNSHTYLTEARDIGDTYVKVNDTKTFCVGERLYVKSGHTITHGLISNVDSVIKRIYTSLSMSMPKYSHVTVRPYKLTGKTGTRGFPGFKLGSSRLGTAPISNKKRKKTDESRRKTLLTTVIYFPYEPSDAIKDLARYLIDFMGMFRGHYVFVYNDFEPNRFVLGRSRLGFSDRL